MRRLPAESEAAFQQKVEQLAGFYGWRHYHAPDNSPRTAKSGRRYVQNVKAGFPDLVLVRPPDLIVAELKREKGRLTAEQQAWLEAFTACGVEAYVWRPSDFDGLHERLARGRFRAEPAYATETA